MKRGLLVTFLIFGISIFTVSYSNVQTEIAQADDQEDVNKELFESLKEITGNADVAAIALEALDLFGDVMEQAEQLADNRIIVMMKHSVLSHAVNIVDGSIALAKNEDLTIEQKVSMVSIPVSVLVTVSALRKLGNSSRLAFLSKYRGGVRVAGRKVIMRMPSFVMRMTFLAAGFITTDAVINSLAKKVIDISIYDAQKLKEVLEEALKEAKKEVEQINMRRAQS